MSLLTVLLRPACRFRALGLSHSDTEGRKAVLRTGTQTRSRVAVGAALEAAERLRWTLAPDRRTLPPATDRLEAARDYSNHVIVINLGNYRQTYTTWQRSTHCMAEDDSDEYTENPIGSEQPLVMSPLSLDALLHLLAHHHRRDILRFLQHDPNHTAHIDELIAHLIDRERERTGKTPGRTTIQRELHCIHLPELTATNLITYTACSQTVYYRPNDRIEGLLRHLHAYEDDPD